MHSTCLVLLICFVNLLAVKVAMELNCSHEFPQNIQRAFPTHWKCFPNSPKRTLKIESRRLLETTFFSLPVFLPRILKIFSYLACCILIKFSSFVISLIMRRDHMPVVKFFQLKFTRCIKFSIENVLTSK